MALILCIETGTDTCSVALARDGQLVALCESAADRDHARNLGPYIDRALQMADLSVSQLDAVAVSKGPGSYTGLRIGVSLAKGMCYALDIPLVSVGSLRSLAAMAVEEFSNGGFPLADMERTLLCPMIDARRMEVYAGVFDWWLNPLSPVGAHIIDAESFSEFEPEEGGEFIIFGDGAAKCAGVLSHRARYVDVKPSAHGLIADAQAAFDAARFEDTAYFEPFYLKDFVVTTRTTRPGKIF